MKARLLTLRTEAGFYVLLDGDPQMLREDGDAFVAVTSYRGDQLVLELLAEISYRLGSERGRFRGSVWNSISPLVDEDHWDESDAPGIRTYHGASDGYVFFPYTLSDVRTVTRCGTPEVLISMESMNVTGRLSLGGQGFGLIGLPRSMDPVVRALLQQTSIPVVDDFEQLRDYIADDGTLTY